MIWTERETEVKEAKSVIGDKAKSLDKTKEECFPVVSKEVTSGKKIVSPIEFQSVRSPGIYEAEFADKDNDIIFHFWPWGYHKAERTNLAPPRFMSGFRNALKEIMESIFDKGRVEILEDPDVGAIYVRAIEYSANQFHKEMAIEACKKLHLRLGGSN